MNLLLPIVEITVVSGKTEKIFNCLLDSGSQRFYLSDGVLDILHCRSTPMQKRDFVIKTFLRSARRSLKELELRVNFLNLECSVPFLFDKGLDLQFDGLSAAAKNIIAGGSKLAADFSCVRDDCISVHGLIGVDVLKYMGSMHLIRFMNGSAFEFPQDIVPFGDVSDFLCSAVEAADSCVSSLNYSQVVSRYSQ